MSVRLWIKYVIDFQVYNQGCTLSEVLQTASNTFVFLKKRVLY